MLLVIMLDGTLLVFSSLTCSDTLKVSSLSTSTAWPVESLIDCLPSLKDWGTVSIAIQFLDLVSSAMNTHWWDPLLYLIGRDVPLRWSNM